VIVIEYLTTLINTVFNLPIIAALWEYARIRPSNCT